MGTRDEGPEEAPDLVYSSAHRLDHSANHALRPDGSQFTSPCLLRRLNLCAGGERAHNKQTTVAWYIREQVSPDPQAALFRDGEIPP